MCQQKKKDENLFSKINKILSKFDIKIKRNFLRYEQNQNINFSKIYQYDFTNFFEKVKKNNKIVNKEIRTIKLINNKLIINKKTFDRVYIPFYNSINKIIINKKVLKIPYQKIKSQHIIAVSRKKFLKDIYYVENFSEFFDRAQVLNKKNFNIFIARISRIYKEKDLSFFIKKMFFIKRKDLIYVKKNSYMNYYRNKNQIKKIKKINNKKMIIVDTRSLFVSIKKYILQAGRNV